MHPYEAHGLRLTRRTFLNSASKGIGAAALWTLLAGQGAARADTKDLWRGVVNPPHVRPRAKRVIHLCMAGGPSHLETLDYKPRLAEMHGQPMPESFTKGQQIAQLQNQELRCFGPQFSFRACGNSGQRISEALPFIGQVADDICIVRSMRTEQINHDPAHTFFNTGTAIPGRPSMGSWILYGLGSEAENLPGFIVMTSVGGGQAQPISSRQWHSGFLPSRFQGVQFHAAGEAVHYVGNPPGVTRGHQADVVSAVGRINALANDHLDDPEIAARIAQYEMAFRMQASVPELLDTSDEPSHILEMYGCTPGDGTFASNCLLARRLAERGVRFIQLYHRGWDHHGGIKGGIRTTAGLVDRGTAALITDLRQRGMLEDTLIIWGGEFGRTPMAQGDGRDHHIQGYSLFLAGAGVRGGMSYGETDELGYSAVVNPVHVRDLHATMLHLLGIDHERLSVPFQGLDVRLTGVEPARVVREVLT